MKNTKIIALIISTIFFSCNSKHKTTDKNIKTEIGTEISYKEARNYFIKNNVKNTIPIKIINQEQFDQYFGMATVMGKNGQPTSIDFSKEFVIVIDPGETKNNTQIMISSLEKKGNLLIVNYNFNQVEPAEFLAHPFSLLIVSKNNNGKVVLNKK